MYLVCLEGSVSVSFSHSDPDNAQSIPGSSSLERHDAAEIIGPSKTLLSTSSDSKSHLLVVEMAFDSNGGRKDI